MRIEVCRITVLGRHKYFVDADSAVTAGWKTGTDLCVYEECEVDLDERFAVTACRVVRTHSL